MILIGPFILKLKDSRLEAYPAIIFPSGASKVNIDKKTFSFTSIEILGYREDSISRIPIKNFLGSIPPQYIYVISEANFGLSPFQQKFKLYTPPIEFLVTNKNTPSKRKNTSLWIQERLRTQGLNESIFILRQYEKVYNLDTHTITSKKLRNEKVYRLD